MAKRSVIASPLVSLGFDASDYKAGMEAAGTWVQRFAGVASASFKSISIPGNLLTKNLVDPISSSMDAVGKVGNALQAPFAKLMDQEKAISEIRLLSGSISQAQSTFAELRSTSRETGQEVGTLAGHFKTLRGAGYSVEESANALGRFAAISGALGEGGLGRLVEASAGFAKNTYAGVESLDKLAAEGLPIYQALAAELSRIEGRTVSIQEATLRAASGQVTGSQAQGALTQALKAPEVVAAAKAADNTLSGIFGKILQTWNDYLAQFGQILAKTFNVGAIAEFARGFMDGGRALFETFAGKAGEAVGNLEGSFDHGRAMFDRVLDTAGSVFVQFLKGVENAAQGFVELLAEIRATMAIVSPAKWLESGARMTLRLAPHGGVVANRLLGEQPQQIVLFPGKKPSEKATAWFDQNARDRAVARAGGAIGKQEPMDAQVEAFRQNQQAQIDRGKAQAAGEEFEKTLDPVAMAAKDYTDKMKRATEVAEQMTRNGLNGAALVDKAKEKFQGDLLKSANDFASGLYPAGNALIGFQKQVEQISDQAKLLAATGQDDKAKEFTKDAQARALLALSKTYNPGQPVQFLNSGGGLGSMAELEARQQEKYGKQNLTMAEMAREAMKQAREDAKAIEAAIKEMRAAMANNPDLMAFFN